MNMPKEHQEDGPKHKASQIQSLEHGGVDHHQTMITELRQRLWVSAIMTTPILILSPTIQKLFGFAVPSFRGQEIFIFILGTIVAVYGGLFFYRGAIGSLKTHVADMNVLVSLAVLSGYVYSTATLFVAGGHEFFWEISTLVVILLFGHLMEMRAVTGAAGALKELIKLIPPQSNLLIGTEIKIVNTTELRMGDTILVKPGEKIPIDGKVIDGQTSINEALITGESKPVSKKEGDEVIGGSINGEGSVTVKVTKTGADTALAQIIALVQEAQSSKPRSQRLADRAAHYLTIIAVIAALLTFSVWELLGATLLFSMTLTITVLVIACPHALGLAIPTVTSISTSLAAKNGLLTKKAQGLEQAKDAQVIIYDKTGTLTEGHFGVTDIITTGELDKKAILQKAAAVEIFSEHTIAKSLINEAKKNAIEVTAGQHFQAIAGHGAQATVENDFVYVGGKSLMLSQGINITNYRQQIEDLGKQGKSVIFLATGNKLQAIIALADIIRKESYLAVDGLKSLGKEVWMITGDTTEVASFVAAELGLTSFFAEVKPEEKANAVKKLQEKGKMVAFVGDGINDAPALVQANIGIAVGAGTDVAIESAEIVLVRNDPRDVLKLINLSKASGRKMIQNLFWATGYNVVAIPAAAGVFIPLGITLGPEIGAVLMSVSSVIVVINALFLKRVSL